MLFLRRATSAIGPRARISLPISITPAATARCFSVTPLLKQDTQAASPGIEGLPSTIRPPWKVSDLGWEQKYYERYGPNYPDLITDQQKRGQILYRMRFRQRIEEELKAALGDDKSDAWYEVLKEANQRQQRYAATVLDEFGRRRKELQPWRKAQATPEQAELQKEMREWSVRGFAAKGREFRQQVVEERRRAQS
ncbi:hypothetical protein N0V82_001587 [Gnomoniopsis sp. IMI 355080]|nr:hypothetical protein N0V82_001587 [Gnomoniopsis sp. IMI 355080]